MIAVFQEIGFTGTQHGMTYKQHGTLRHQLSVRRGHLHHGDCIGSDAQAHELARALGYGVIIHPPSNPSKRAYCQNYKAIGAPKPYLDRNKDIVLMTTFLIAAPREFEEQLRSGTWSTIRFAHRMLRPILVVYPDGRACRYLQR